MSQEEKLRSAAEQFLASLEDGNTAELLEYFAELFRDALGKAN